MKNDNEILRGLGHKQQHNNYDVIKVISNKVSQTGGFLADSPQSAQTQAQWKIHRP
jgi:hypothetical protein